mmetsp:Transcript_42241/g.132286  ORF Transcript_42241/g.132286 Transcript_42241/m.132286 type:complete len:412 (-) Transcript_42241:217-1452(-)
MRTSAPRATKPCPARPTITVSRTLSPTLCVKTCSPFSCASLSLSRSRSRQDAVGEPLVAIVLLRAARVQALREELYHVLLRPDGGEALRHLAHGHAALVLRAEAELQQRDDGARALLEAEEPGHEQPLELPEGRGADAAEQVHVLPRHLEGRSLPHDGAGVVPQHEAEVDVDDAPEAVDEQVRVVPVLHAEHVAQDGVARERARELLLRDVEGGAVGRAEGRLVDAAQVLVRAGALLELVDGHGVGHHLHEPRVVRGGDDVVGVQPNGDAVLREGLLGEHEHLVRELLLPQVFAGLDDDGAQAPPGYPAEGAALPHALLPHLLGLAEDAVDTGLQGGEGRQRRVLLHHAHAVAAAHAAPRGHVLHVPVAEVGVALPPGRRPAGEEQRAAIAPGAPLRRRGLPRLLPLDGCR